MREMDEDVIRADIDKRLPAGPMREPVPELSDVVANAHASLGERLRTRWHSWRRQRRTELKNHGVHAKDAVCLVGAIVAAHSQKSSINGNYVGFDAKTII